MASMNTRFVLAMACAVAASLALAGTPADSVPAAPAVPAAVSEAEFLRVLQADCARCHANAGKSLAMLQRAGWIRPGDPQGSRMFRVLGKGKKGHNIPEKDRQTIYEFIAGMPKK